MSIMKNWEGLKIPFEKIDVATENFKTCIGRGGYGWVYKGVLSINGKDTTVAIKRLNERFGQGLKEFLTEIPLLSGQEHPNLISLLGYCDDGKEKILVYEYVARGSLDRFIRRNRDESSTTLTWLERLKICADAARGLDHLHNHIGGHRTIIHRDIKSSNILIDENWVAKISDLGLSKLSATGFGMSAIVSNGCGTQGYCEPEYYNSGVVTKKSDVYSFGIVLFEVLCGRLCIIESDNNGFTLHERSVKECYNKGNLVKIIDPSLREHMGSYSMTKFSEIAYRCLHDDREQRPAMDIVAKELEETLNVQVEHELEENDVEYWEKKLPDNYERYIEMSDIPLNYTAKKEHYLLFCRGFLSNNGQLWFSTCKSTRGICSIQPANRVLFKDPDYNTLETLSLPESRFKEVKKLGNRDYYEFTCRLESFMFSPGNYNYAYYLVFKLKEGHVLSTIVPFFQASWILGGKDVTMYNTVYFLGGNAVTIPIRPKKPKEESGSSKSIDGGRGMSKQYYVDSSTSWVEKRDDGWLEARLTKPLFKHDLENCKELVIHFYAWKKGEIGWSLNGMILEGVEFRPVVVDNNGWIISSS